MSEQKKDFGITFLLGFTNHLIKNSNTHKIIEIKQREKINEPKEILKLQQLEKIPIRKRKFISIKSLPLKKSIIPNQNIKKLTIPHQRLPPKFQDIKPLPTKIEINLGKLNPIIENPTTNAIECKGPNFPISIITQIGSKKNTNIILSKEEINKILQTFSQASKIPLTEGVYKVAAGKLLILAVISEITGSRFIIKKIPIQQKRIINQNFYNIRTPKRF